MKAETPHTIADLWNEADGLIRLSIPHIEKLASPDYRVNEERRPIYAQQLASCNERLQSLRQQLLDSGDHDRAQDGRHVSLAFEGNGIVSVDVAAIVRCNSDDLRNLAARAKFTAWESEHRENEASNR